MTSISDTEVVNAPGGLVELGQATNAFDVAATTGTGTSVGFNLSVVCDGSPIVVEFTTSLMQHFANVSTFLVLYMDGSAVGTFANFYSGVYEEGPVTATRRLTPSVGLHTFDVRVVSGGGGTNGGIYANNGSGTNRTPHLLRVSKVIQASQLLVTQSNAPIVTSLPSGNLVTGQEVDHLQNNVMLRKKWDGSSWITLNAGGSTQPRFAVYNDGGSQINATNKATFNSIAINDGNCWNSNTFTAPVTGKYFFSYSLLSATSTAFYVEFRKNGSSMPTNSFPRGYVAIQYVANTGSGIISLNQNDYIELWVTGGSMHAYHCSFTGYLMG